VESDPPAFVRVEPDLAAFVVTHYDRLIRLAMLLSRDSSDAADAVQAGLEQAWRRRSTLRDQDRLRPWLDRIVVREAIRASRRRTSLIGRLLGLDRDVRWIEPARDDRSRLDLRDALRGAIGRLSVEQRAVVIVHLHLGYSLAETAEVVGAPLETVRSRLRTARANLRKSLEDHQG
jgi:RNA polymerase sigma-70 factor (ECF subfamily)